MATVSLCGFHVSQVGLSRAAHVRFWPNRSSSRRVRPSITNSYLSSTAIPHSAGKVNSGSIVNLPLENRTSVFS